MPIHPHPNDRIIALAESKENLKAGELWKVERVDHISDWTKEVRKPNPLSLKSNVPSSWFVGLNDAVAAKVQVSFFDRVSCHMLMFYSYHMHKIYDMYIR